MKTPHSNAVRYALVGLTGFAVGLLLAAGAGAGEIATDPADRAAELPAANLPAAEQPDAFVPLDAALVLSVSLPAADTQSLGHRGSTIGDGEDAMAAIGTGCVITWLPTGAVLPGDAAPIEAFLAAIRRIHPAGVPRMVCEMLRGLPNDDSPATPYDGPPLQVSLRERDSFAAAEVAFALGNIATPEPDFLFLAFVALQSLWGLVSRPRDD